MMTSNILYFGLNIYAGETKKMGRGIFAYDVLKEGQLIEVSPLIVLSAKEYKKISKTVLSKYVFACGKGAALALGLGSLFNHSSSPNAVYKVSKKKRIVTFTASRHIEADEQIFIDYGYDPRDYD